MGKAIKWEPGLWTEAPGAWVSLPQISLYFDSCCRANLIIDLISFSMPTEGDAIGCATAHGSHAGR